MVNLRKVVVLAGISWPIFAAHVNAASLVTSGIWTDAMSDVPGIVDGEKSNQISWGTPLNSQNLQSSYVFEGVSETVDVNDLVNSQFLLGEFTHNNFTILLADGSLTSATLNINLNLDGLSQTFSFDFTHFETLNDSSPCPAGGEQPCPDLVSFSNSTSSQFITLDGIDYELELSGFSQSGPNDLTSGFLTSESQVNTAQLYAQLNEVGPQPVPEPNILIGLTLVGGTAMSMKQKHSGLR